MNSASTNVRNVVIVPTYNETKALPIFLASIIEHLDEDMAIIISDDSDINNANEMRHIVKEFNQKHRVPIFLNSENSNSGRGYAVHRAMKYALQEFEF